MATSTILLVAAIAGIIAWDVFFAGKLPVPFGARSCQGRNWRRSFPNAPKDEIRQFLSTFTESFAFQDREKLKLNPNDQLLDIYRALYPHKWQADALEFETLSEDLQSKYGVNFNSTWREGLTLGQLFEHVQQARK
jgi:propanediol dehydratase small subunit